MIHFDIPYKGHKSDACFLPDQSGAVGDRVIKFPGNILQGYGSVVIMDIA